jgi:hypothetical protein
MLFSYGQKHSHCLYICTLIPPQLNWLWETQGQSHCCQERTRQDSWVSPAKKIMPLEKKFCRKLAPPSHQVKTSLVKISVL